MSFYLSLPSSAAAPPGIILVMNIPGSSPMCGLSVPPAILNPRPEFPWKNERKVNASADARFPQHLFAVHKQSIVAS